MERPGGTLSEISYLNCGRKKWCQKGKQGTTWHKCVIISAVALAKYHHVRYYTVCCIHASGPTVEVEQPDLPPVSFVCA
jgi:hypothetical protein